MQRAIVTACVLGALGCAAEPPPPAVSPAPPPPAAGHQPITELDALEHDLDRAAERLDQQLEKKRRAPILEDQPAPSKPPPRSRDKPPAQTERSDDSTATEKDSTEPAGQVGSPCDLACRALGSMRRSAARICELAGEAHERCVRARSKLAEAERRVGGSGCECKKRDDQKLISSLFD